MRGTVAGYTRCVDFAGCSLGRERWSTRTGEVKAVVDRLRGKESRLIPSLGSISNGRGGHTMLDEAEILLGFRSLLYADLKSCVGPFVGLFLS